MARLKVPDAAAKKAVDEAAAEEARKRKEEKQPRPYRVQFNFTAVDTPDVEDLMAIYDALVAEAERRGFFFEWGVPVAMDEDDVIEESPLAQALDSMREAYWR